MPIQPIDLQNLFLRMNQISKEQAQSQEVAAQQQSVQNSQFLKEINHRDHSVNQPEEMTDQTKKTDEDGTGNQGKKGTSSGEEKEKNKQTAKVNIEYVTDPNLGHHIDISG